MLNGMSASLVFGVPVLVMLGFWLAALWERRRLGALAGQGFFARNGFGIGTYLLIAVGFWMLMLIVLPQFYMVEYSFHPKLPQSARGGPLDHYTLENYRYFLFGSPTATDSFNTTHLRAFFLTLFVSLCITVADFVICYPLAFYMAQRAGTSALRKCLLLLVIPYWVNELLRAFAFRVIFSTSGLLNSLLKLLGLIDTPIDFIGNDIALYAGLSYAFLLIMIFPLYNAIESLDRNQIEAARDLGAGWARIHGEIVMPHAKPGIASGCTLVFMLCAGSLAAPQILGGPKTLWFTPIVYDRFFQAFNWPQGSAYAIILLLACILFVMAMMRLFKVSLSEIAR